MDDIVAGNGLHTKDLHICQECRCHHIAGFGSRGWWYWPPDNSRRLPEVGHYGIGPCYKHANRVIDRIDRLEDFEYADMIEKEIVAMQDKGIAPNRTVPYLEKLDELSAQAQVRQDTRTALFAIKRLAQETLDQLRRYRGTTNAQDIFFHALADIFGVPPEMLTSEDKDRLMQAAMARPLTELSQGRLIPMSDKTSITLEKDLIKEIGNQAKTVFQVREDDYILKDEVVVLIRRFLSAVENIYGPKGTEDDWLRLKVEMQSIGKQLEVEHKG
jgi:hypothetical protein